MHISTLRIIHYAFESDITLCAVRSLKTASEGPGAGMPSNGVEIVERPPSPSFLKRWGCMILAFLVLILLGSVSLLLAKFIIQGQARFLFLGIGILCYLVAGLLSYIHSRFGKYLMSDSEPA